MTFYAGGWAIGTDPPLHRALIPLDGTWIHVIRGGGFSGGTVTGRRGAPPNQRPVRMAAISAPGARGTARVGSGAAQAGMPAPFGHPLRTTSLSAPGEWEIIKRVRRTEKERPA